MKKSKKILITIVSLILVICIGVGGVFLFQEIQERNESNTYDSVYNTYLKTIEKISTKQGVDTENAENLYLSIFYNDCLTYKEKEYLLNFIQYFVDNQYIDCDEVCNKLSTFTVNKNNPDLLDLGISAEYTEDNSITFANKTEREYALAHEIHHCIENAALPYETMDWFGEGFTCLVDYEYFDHTSDGENIQAFFVRSLCELVGPQVLFKVSGKGDPKILENALIERGVDKKTIKKVYNLFRKVKDQELGGDEEFFKLRYQTVEALLDMYNVVYDNPPKISRSFYESVELFFGISENSFDNYYINSQKRNTFDLQKKYVTQADFEYLLECERLMWG